SQWERLMPLIIKMDKPTKQVLVEVTIAEVTLSDKEKFGIEWFANGKNGRYNSTISSQPSENIGGVGLNWVLDVAGATKATLNAFAEDSRVNVISTPRLLVKTGETASLDVVTEIPTVVGRVNSNAQSNGNSNVIEEIVYRKTGVILKVEPIIHAGNRVDLKISQEVSEVLPVESGGTANSPALFNRNVETNLSLHSGGSVYLAGLISSRENNGSTGVPLLKDLPWIGNAFKSQSKNTTRTELVITIVPYIITDENDAKDITDSLLSNLNFIKQEKDLTQRPKTPTINPTKK
ncbi:MAG: general secretion pathway protein GspD, partial [Gammaproteobacteria bacterium CG22_combo_CG10-13_8_21_14_all_40_8]